MINPHTNH